MDLISYITLRIFILIFSILPLKVLYIFSDLIAFIIHDMARYRRKIVTDNLSRSFPGMEPAVRQRISRMFYRHMADLLVESLKSFTMSEKQIVKRYRFVDVTQLETFYREGRPVICVAGHFGNWEWGGPASGTQLLHKPVGFYKPLSNKYIDRYIQRTRIKGRARLASISQTSETFLESHGEPAIYYMVADQSPSSNRYAHWLTFLGQDTAVLHGPEKYARIHNLPVVFAAARKIARGRYEVVFRLVTDDPLKMETGRITGRFMEMLEEEIRRQPAYYLWSHRRWKLKRPQA